MKVSGNTARPRKRSRQSDDADDVVITSGAKKARGRPRVDTQDATAADVSNKILKTEGFQHHSFKRTSQNPETTCVHEANIGTSVEGPRSVSHSAHIDNARKQRYPH